MKEGFKDPPHLILFLPRRLPAVRQVTSGEGRVRGKFPYMSLEMWE